MGYGLVVAGFRLRNQFFKSLLKVVIHNLLSEIRKLNIIKKYPIEILA